MVAERVADPSPYFTAEAVRATRWHFLALCVYLLSQSFTIPILPIGPSWAIWPGLPDFAMGLFVLVVIVKGFSNSFRPTSSQTQLFKFLLAILFLCVHSFFLFRFVRVLDPVNPLTGDAGFVFGIYQLYRLVQFFFLYWVIIRIPLTPKRIAILRPIVFVVLLIVCAGVFITHYKIMQTIAFVNHLPSDSSVSGPWNIYWTYTRLDLAAPFGMVGYNHSYVGAQCLILLALFLHLREGKASLLDVGLIGIAIFTVFLSESRAGLVAIVLYGMIFFLQRPRVTYSVAMLVGLASILVLAGILPNPLERLISDSTIERSLTLFNATEAENLSDRDIIWEDRLEFLNADLTRWLLGSGFGNTVNSGSNAHMLPLHLIVETGLFGLTIFGLLGIWVLRTLWRYDWYIKPIFWATVMLLVSSATQETFYPVPSLSYFLGLYLTVVAITLRERGEEVHETVPVEVSPVAAPALRPEMQGA